MEVFFDLFIGTGVARLFETGDVNTVVGKSGVEFAYIRKNVPIADILDMYDLYHEMDIQHFVDRMNEICDCTITSLGLRGLGSDGTKIMIP